LKGEERHNELNNVHFNCHYNDFFNKIYEVSCSPEPCCYTFYSKFRCNETDIIGDGCNTNRYDPPIQFASISFTCEQDQEQ
ncbi:4554_t:CDS:1, partial [Dentiscutata erythropus]